MAPVQPSASPPPLPRRLAGLARLLACSYGRPTRPRNDPLDSLLSTVLSQSTTEGNSSRAFRNLKAAFPGWENVARARPGTIERAIRVGGLARTKSRRIVRILREIRAREGRCDLRWLRRLDVTTARRWLDGLPGVGPKTRACVLLFSCGHPAFPVDTHVHRVARRLGLVPTSFNPGQAQKALEPHVPQDRALDLHLNMIRLGREVCRPTSPRCSLCPVRPDCAHGGRPR